ncbi:MAG TPA: ABC transporter permease [Flavobacteriales bacterium]|nr:ABC transporter permease [Flavobacteriales bacterium]
MTLYLLKRILQFIPTLFIISLLAFYISVHSPGDPVEILSQSANAQGANASLTATKQYKDSVRAQLGLNLPLFYFSFCTRSDCDTLHKIFDKQERYAFHRLSRKCGDWQKVALHFKNIESLKTMYDTLNADVIYKRYAYIEDTATELIPMVGAKTTSGEPVKYVERRLINNTLAYKYTLDEINTAISIGQNLVSALKKTYEPIYIFSKIDTLISSAKKYEWLLVQQANIVKLNRHAQVFTESHASNNYIPKFVWNGTKSQYHVWLVNLLQGNFGYSYVDSRPVAEKIWEKFGRSFALVFLAVLLSYIVSIPIGVYSARKHGKFFDRFSSVALFMLYSVPSFFFGTLLLYLFANPAWFAWFPEYGYCDPQTYDNNWNFFERIYYTFPYMVLPLATYMYASIAFLSRTVRSATLETLNQDYVRTARAKGLSENRVLWRHAFRNALLPVITTFVTIFPAAVGGSVIVETIFTYDGMGIASFEAIGSKDIPMIVSIFSLAGLMSMIAYFIADILYAVADPRIVYANKE